jgi:hypothetical protein
LGTIDSAQRACALVGAHEELRVWGNLCPLLDPEGVDLLRRVESFMGASGLHLFVRLIVIS